MKTGAAMKAAAAQAAGNRRLAVQDQIEAYEERNSGLPVVSRDDILTPQGTAIGVVELERAIEEPPMAYLPEARTFCERFQDGDNRFVEHFVASRMAAHMGLDQDNKPLRAAIRAVLIERGASQYSFTTPVMDEELRRHSKTPPPEPPPAPTVVATPAPEPTAPRRTLRELLQAWLDCSTRSTGMADGAGGCLLCSEHYPHMRGSCVCDATRAFLNT